MLAPKRIERTPENALKLTWSDGRECAVPLKLLRDECPCAHCKGEEILGKVYLPVMLPTFVEGMYEISNIVPVGNYAIQIAWKDGHATGIYTWEYLDVLCSQAIQQASEAEGVGREGKERREGTDFE